MDKRSLAGCSPRVAKSQTQLSTTYTVRISLDVYYSKIKMTTAYINLKFIFLA